MKSLAFALLCFGNSVLAQNGKLDNALVFDSRFIVTISQAVCASADTIYFTLWDTQKLNQRKKSREIFNLYLVNSAGKSVHHQKFIATDGIGNNQIIIPENIESGYHLLTIYPMEYAEATVAVTKEISIVKKKQIKKQTVESLRAGGEGGPLIESILNHLVVVGPPSMANKKFGLYEDQTLLKEILFDPYSTAKTEWIPEVGKKYFVRSNELGENKPLITSPNGISCQVQMESDQLRVHLKSSPSSADQLSPMHVVIKNSFQTFFQELYTPNAERTLSFSLKELPKGLLYVNIYSEQDSEKPIICRPFINYKGADIFLFNIDKDTFSSRGKIAGKFELNSTMRKDEILFYSIRAISHRLLPQDVSGPISQPDYASGNLDFFSNSKLTDRELSLDNYLSISNRGLKRAAGNQPPGKIRYQKLLIRGQAVMGPDNKPVPDSTLIISFLQKNMIGNESRTRKGGKFEIRFFTDFLEDDELFYFAEHNNKELLGVKLIVDESGSEFLPAPVSIETKMDDTYAQFVKDKRLINQSFASFAPHLINNSVTQSNSNAEFEEEVGKIDFVKNIMEYTSFSTMVDLIKNVVPGLYVIGPEKKAKVHVAFNVPGLKATSGPVFIIDGIFTKDMNYFMQLSPLDLVSIKVVRDLNTLSRFGEFGKNGFIIVQTKKNDPSKVKVTRSFIPVVGLTNPIEFNSSSTPPNIPDLRTLLYWNSGTGRPDAFTFFLNDDIGPVKISIEAFTKKGERLYAEKEIMVIPE